MYLAEQHASLDPESSASFSPEEDSTVVGALRSVRVGLLTGLVLLLVAGRCLARRWRWGGAVVRPPVGNIGRGGIGPWWTWPQYEHVIDRSPYYERYGLIGPWWTWPQYQNVYTPYATSNAYPYPYPVPAVYGVAPPPPNTSTQVNVDASSPSVPLPYPTGPTIKPPSDAALIRLKIPDRFGQVWFVGARTTTIGTTRNYITPPLLGDRPLLYDVRVSFDRNGEIINEDRTVTVSPGQTTIVDFTRDQGAQTGGR
jgi:uncharacterized protein (TIGR03000 family)